MASGGKKKTTMAKLDRERRMRERRTDKQARKAARKQLAANGGAGAAPDAPHADDSDGSAEQDPLRPALEPAGTVRAGG